MKYTGAEDRALAQGLIIAFLGLAASVFMYLLLERPMDTVTTEASSRSGSISNSTRASAYLDAVEIVELFFGNYLGFMVAVLAFTLIVYAVYSRGGL